jgi:hypothetical protein
MTTSSTLKAVSEESMTKTSATPKAGERKRTTKMPLLTMTTVHTQAQLVLLPNKGRAKPERVRTTSTPLKTILADQDVAADEIISELNSLFREVLNLTNSFKITLLIITSN